MAVTDNKLCLLLPCCQIKDLRKRCQSNLVCRQGTDWPLSYGQYETRHLGTEKNILEAIWFKLLPCCSIFIYIKLKFEILCQNLFLNAWFVTFMLSIFSIFCGISNQVEKTTFCVFSDLTYSRLCRI